MTTTADAPSEICEALPAVMDPSRLNAGRKPASDFGCGARPDPLVGLDDERVTPCAEGPPPG